MRLIADALAAGLPIPGVCLGSQMLASAAGAAVTPGKGGQEIGWDTVRLEPGGMQDALCACLADETGSSAASVFQWHGDTFDLPPGAELLACSGPYSQQAIRLWGRLRISVLL